MERPLGGGGAVLWGRVRHSCCSTSLRVMDGGVGVGDSWGQEVRWATAEPVALLVPAAPAHPKLLLGGGTCLHKE